MLERYAWHNIKCYECISHQSTMTSSRGKIILPRFSDYSSSNSITRIASTHQIINHLQGGYCPRLKKHTLNTILSRLHHDMSHPVLYSAVRLSRPQAARASVPAASSPALAFNFSAPFSHTSYRTAITHATSKRSTEIRPSKLSRVPRLRSTFIQPRSPFSSASSPAAQVTQNPRTDDDGNTLMIGISERAANVRSVLNS
jgi:hypothetical protein